MNWIDKLKGKNPALAYNEFLYYLMIRFGLIFALSMQFTIVAYNVFHLTGQSKMALGLIGLAEVIPIISCSFFAGYWVDKSEKRGLYRKLIVAYIILGFGLYACFDTSRTTFISHSSRMAAIYSLIFIGGIFRAFLGPTSFSMLGLVVPKSLYPNATSWSSLSWQLGSVLGPVVGGLLIVQTGPANGMFVVFLLEVLLLVPISLIGTKPILMRNSKEPVLKSVGEGLKFVFSTPPLLGALCLDMFSVLFGGAVALLPAIQAEFYPEDGTMFSGAGAFGILRAAPGIGAIATMILLAFIPLKKQPGRELFICVACFGLCIVGFGLSRVFILSWVFLAASGMFDAVSVVIRGTILQLVTPDDMRGRVSSVNTMFISSSNELGDFESGLMANWLGTVPAIVVGGTITLGVVVVTYFRTPSLRRFKFEDYTVLPPEVKSSG
ncbi:MAG: hypothetical protein BGO09_03300 [Bacteroidetes bacterium 47-18]|nr:MAG: hypothetical protein BGO09_03300 [Bacteroidetes bacterium 47-18]